MGLYVFQSEEDGKIDFIIETDAPLEKIESEINKEEERYYNNESDYNSVYEAVNGALDNLENQGYKYNYIKYNLIIID